jgi:murein DD-endopeptidase MepM/ murein hydrolase activator NlpD
MVKPVRNPTATVTSGYGTRTIPNGTKEFHGGIDIAVTCKEEHIPIYATCDGVITARTDASASCGNSWFVRADGKDFYCLYFHLAYTNPDLRIGDRVKAGDYLGAMGNTGNSRGVHLHYGHRKGMESGTETLDPQEVRRLYT